MGAALFLFGLAFLLLKVVDFALLPEQKKKIQNFFEDMTLRVDGLDVSRVWDLGDPAVQAACAMVAYTQVIVLSVLGFVLYPLLHWVTGLSFDSTSKALMVASVALSLATMVTAWRWPLPGLVHWVVGKGRRSFVIARMILMMFVASLVSNISLQVLPLLLGPPYYRTGSELHIYSWSSLIALLLLSPVVTILWIVANSVGIMLWPRQARRGFRLTRATLWRVAEFKTGAVGAIVLIIGTVLGLLQLVLQAS